MAEGSLIEIYECQEWIRTAPLKEVQEFIHWARGVVEMREEFAAQTKRKRRSDAGKSREDQPIDLKEIVK